MSLSLTLQRRPQRPHLDYKKTRTEKSYGVNTRCLIEVEKRHCLALQNPLQWSKIIQKLLIKDVTLLRM